MLERAHEQARKRLESLFRAEVWKLNQEAKSAMPVPKSEIDDQLSVVTLPSPERDMQTKPQALRTPLIFKRQGTFGTNAFLGLWGCDDGLMVP